MHLAETRKDVTLRTIALPAGWESRPRVTVVSENTQVMASLF